MTPNEQALERSKVRSAARRASSTRPPATEEDETEPSPRSKRTLRGRQTWDAAVKRVDRPTETLALLQLEVESGTFQFQAGQFTMVHGVGSDGPRRRAYSIASPPSWLPRLDLAISVVNDQGESGWLYDRRPGDVLKIEQAHGKFLFRTNGRPAVFMATGTGVAPFRAILHDQWDHGVDPEVWLFLGARHVAGLPYHEELKAADEAHVGFEYVPAVSRPAKPWEGVTGHVQAPFLARFEGRTDFDAYLCGSPAMVADSRGMLLKRGLAKNQIFQERYS